MFVWRPEDNFQELVLAFYHVGSRKRIQIYRRGGLRCYLQSHLTGLCYLFLIVEIS